MQTQIREVLVTPQMAQRALDDIKHPIRHVSAGTVDAYARDMLNGNWIELHPQPIIYDKKDELMDGVHRYHAIIRANKPVKMIILSGYDRKKTLATIDRGRPRSISHWLQIECGVKNASNVAAIATRIIAMVMGESQRVSNHSVLYVYNLYKPEFEQTLENVVFAKKMAVSSVLAAFVFGAKINPSMTEDFEIKYFSGEGIFRDDPVYRFRTYMLAGQVDYLRNRRRSVTHLCLTALKNHIYSKPMKRLFVDENIVNWYFEKQEKECNAIRKYLKLNGSSL